MITERKEDLVTVEADSYIEKLLEKYFRAFVGDRDGNIYSQEERPIGTDSGEARGIDQFAAGG